MTAFQAAAEGGDRSAVVVDTGLRVKKMPACEQWLNSEGECAIAAVQTIRNASDDLPIDRSSSGMLCMTPSPAKREKGGAPLPP
jgi:hypothetical protein